ncbi:MAG TPA: glutamate synthase-related protein [Candidatus Limnocylindria bacterium]|nr:glutamate synthase-related protein [Candidatus Limnocylindria bacterium]
MADQVREERDACALVAVVRKDGLAAREPLATALRGLDALAHRSGEIEGEGDGSGVLTDLPRDLWADLLVDAGAAAAIADDRRFAVGHFFLPRAEAGEARERIRTILRANRARIVLERDSVTRRSALLARGRAEEPVFWQVALLAHASGRAADAALHRAAVEIEARTGATVVSLSRHTVVYKIRGSARQLDAYYPDLADPRFRTSMAFGHNRYSTNTASTFERVQPFAAFAHNGEIDTIGRLREEARALRIALSRDGSDSQDVDAVLRGLTLGSGLDLVEAVELLFPPIVNEIKRMPPEQQDAYMHARAAFGPFAQGPAAFLARVGDVCAFGVDAMGLRPLWHVETDDDHVFASERGFIPLSRYSADPRPLRPGERVLLERRSGGWRVVPQDQMRRRFVDARARRGIDSAGARERIETGGPLQGPERRRASARVEFATPPDEVDDLATRREQRFAALGWDPDDLRQAAFMEETANEPIGSLGYDGPLAALAPRRGMLADHLHESVAVVTNPAIDREREIEHFSTRVVVGPRPSPHRASRRRSWIELRQPILLGGHDAAVGLAAADARAVANRLGTWTLEDLVARAERMSAHGPAVVEADRDWDEHPRDALARIAAEACGAVRAGARLVVVRDHGTSREGRAWLDPLLVTAAVHRALVEADAASGSLRRDAAVVLSAGSLRNLHDLMCALGLGADAVNPYLLLEHAVAAGDPDALPNLVEALRKGIEKVISTLGMHELRGYGRAFAGIGLGADIARALGVRTFGGGGLGWDDIDRDGFDRASALRERTPARLEPAFRIWPRAWKAALAVATGDGTYEAYATRLEELERDHPVSLRHLLDLSNGARPGPAKPVPAERMADTRVGEHSGPVYISSMSFGSQGETAYRAYAEAMARLDLLCINGEGGELPDLIGRYPANRGQQIASGRFGVSAMLANSSRYLEIKIGQGAKPGEGGHLPGRKVSAKVALARNSQVGVDLISPSNNHDIYSIEDLAQVVHELRTVNPEAYVMVKIPVTPDVGIIACGVAKSGADVVTVSGYDGGTGAARQHALRRAGLPAEIGVAEAHRALVANGLRDKVQLWCDGGMRSALDVVKMLCLGADRVGFGTAAMVAIGCTICRGCQLDTCHVGITTQIESLAEATARGLKKFEPQEHERAVERLCRFFGAIRAEVARLAGALGVSSVRELVGRTDLLEQARGLDRVDLAWMLAPVGWRPGGEVAVAPRAALPQRSAVAGALVPEDRVVATGLAGAAAREVIARREAALVRESYGAVAGNGFAAYATDALALEIAGGAQDGAAKTALGGTVAILKAPNAFGRFVDGAVGKAFAYGAQRGRFFVQGDADARACIRMSGAEAVFGGDLGGFAFEYMTGGAAVVLGDPGRWICSGMSGGAVYLRVDASRGLDDRGLRDRLAKGAKVTLRAPDESEAAACGELLGAYALLLTMSGQSDEAARVRALDVRSSFLVVRPGAEQVDQTISTE